VEGFARRPVGDGEAGRRRADARVGDRIEAAHQVCAAAVREGFDELDAVTTSLADKLNGKVIARRDVVASGIRSRQYDLAYEKDGEGLVDRITFVLKRTDEYYVLCRWLADRGEPEACGLLLRTFATR
jgi:hypothetical protein